MNEQKTIEKEPVKIVERGWIEDLPQMKDCRFRRNTLLQSHNVRFVVVTFGNWHPNNTINMMPLDGKNVYYETRVYRPERHERYWFANPQKRIFFKGYEKPTTIEYAAYASDFAADLMHKKMVRFIERKFQEGVDMSEPKPKKRPKHWRKRK